MPSSTSRSTGGSLIVDDSGQGIAPADLPHVFDRFYRSEESRAMPGSGLGLSIVRQVAERHSGTVAAGTAPGGGARLTLSLPGQPAVVTHADQRIASGDRETRSSCALWPSGWLAWH